jgi:flagellar protein FlaG
MNIDINTSTSGGVQHKILASEQIDMQRKNKEKAADNPQSASSAKGVQNEELLTQIKALTEDGLYSVRFEQNDSADLIVKIFDQKTDKIVRQIPSEELVNLQKALADLRGHLIDTES